MGLGLGTRHQIVFLPAAERPAPTRRRWPLYVALAAQLVLLAFLPGHRVAAQVAGQAITLDVVPVDPVDALRGRYVDLSYRVGNLDRIAGLPGFKADQTADGTAVWLTMESGIGPDLGWRPVAIAYTQPAPPSAGRVLLAGTLQGEQVSFGIDRYHVDASLGETLDLAMSRTGANTRADVRVDAQGRPAVVGLLVDAKRF